MCPAGLRSVEVDLIYLDSEGDLTSDLTLLRWSCYVGEIRVVLKAYTYFCEDYFSFLN